VTVAEGLERPGRERSPRLVGWIVQVGFLTAFAVIALLFGLWFGVQLLGTQRDGIEAINRIQDVEALQTRQLQQLDQRLERLERAAGTGP
jgi:hypothetical protein